MPLLCLCREGISPLSRTLGTWWAHRYPSSQTQGFVFGFRMSVAVPFILAVPPVASRNKEARTNQANRTNGPAIIKQREAGVSKGSLIRVQSLVISLHTLYLDFLMRKKDAHRNYTAARIHGHWRMMGFSVCLGNHSYKGVGLWAKLGEEELTQKMWPTCLSFKTVCSLYHFLKKENTQCLPCSYFEHWQLHQTQEIWRWHLLSETLGRSFDLTGVEQGVSRVNLPLTFL